MKFLIKSWCFIKSIRYVQLVVLSGDSMSPSLLHGDILVTLKLPHFENIIQRDSIVICTPSWIENKYIIKRITGLPLENVILDRYDQVILSASYPQPDSSDINEDLDLKKHWHLNEEEYFIMGDNSSMSTDSRSKGPINKKYLKGVVVYRIWPLNKLGTIKN